MSAVKKRPAGVSVVVALVWFTAALDLFSGAVITWLSFGVDADREGVNSGYMLTYGISVLLIGLLAAAVALGLAAGSRVSRIAVLVLMGLRVVAAGYALWGVPDVSMWQVAGQVLGALLIITLLVTPRANAYFTAGDR